MIGDDIRLLYASPLPPEVKARVFQLVEAGRLSITETPMTYAQLAMESHTAALRARQTGAPTGYHAALYLRYERAKRTAIRKLFE